MSKINLEKKQEKSKNPQMLFLFQLLFDSQSHIGKRPKQGGGGLGGWSQHLAGGGGLLLMWQRHLCINVISVSGRTHLLGQSAKKQVKDRPLLSCKTNLGSKRKYAKKKINKEKRFVILWNSSIITAVINCLNKGGQPFSTGGATIGSKM